MTQRLGLKPQEDEYILMGMAGWGEVNEELKHHIKKDFFKESPLPIMLSQNLHRGCLDWDCEFWVCEVFDIMDYLRSNRLSNFRTSLPLRGPLQE